MTPYIGAIFAVGFNFAPPGYLPCDGSLVSISENQVLFALIGTTYGGDGVNTFGLPDLRGRAPIHQGTGTGLSNYVMGQMGGVESVTLTANQMPIHTHPLLASSAATAAGAPGQFFGTSGRNLYAATSAGTAMGDIIDPIGGNQSHANQQPFQVVNYIIATEGVFPSQN